MNQKQTTVFFIVMFFASVLWSGFVQDCLTDKDVGKVEQIESLYVFYRSKPCSKYEELGTVKVTISMTGKPEEMIELLTKKAKKNFPTGEALIISDANMNTASVVKFTGE